MRILFLSQVLPYPLDAGPKMRSYFVLRYLVQKHEVTLLTFVRTSDKPEDIAHLAELCHAVHTVPMARSRLGDLKFFAKSVLVRQPFLIIRDEVSVMTKMVRQLANSEPFDAIHADQLWMAQYALHARAVSPSSKLILDQHNAVHLIPKRLASDAANGIIRRYLDREARLLEIYEADICRRFDHVVWVTEEDRQAVAALTETTNDGHSCPTVIPICANPTQVKPVVPNPTMKRITFLGGLHWPPNAQGVTWFAKHVYPMVRQAVPEAVLTVIGKSPPAGLAGEGVEITGYVTDLTPYLAETAVFIVPLHAGGGMRVKILDAWSWGLPIVSTTIGAEGINTQHDKDILIADTYDAFAQEVIRLLKNPGLAQQFGQNGRQSVIEKYDWQMIYRAWDDVYQSSPNNT